MEVVINTEGIGLNELSQDAIKKLIEYGWDVENVINDENDIINNKSKIIYCPENDNYTINLALDNKLRNDLILVKLIKELKSQVMYYENDFKYEIINIPDNISWYIEGISDDYYEYEIVREKHRGWDEQGEIEFQ